MVIKFKLVDRVKSQMNAFIDGFGDILPTEQLKEFDATELELLMCGLGKCRLSSDLEIRVLQGIRTLPIGWKIHDT